MGCSERPTQREPEEILRYRVVSAPALVFEPVVASDLAQRVVVELESPTTPVGESVAAWLHCPDAEDGDVTVVELRAPGGGMRIAPVGLAPVGFVGGSKLTLRGRKKVRVMLTGVDAGEAEGRAAGR